MKRQKAVFLNLLLFFVLVPVAAWAQNVQKELPRLFIFHSPSCHRCVETKAELIPRIEKIFKDKLTLSFYNIEDIENYKLMLGLKEKYSPGLNPALPVFYLEGKFFTGDDLGKKDLALFIRETLAGVSVEQPEVVPVIDLTERFKQIGPFAVVGAGLVDGINPCAFTVIVFFISFLALQGYRKKELVVIGLAYILAVFLTYLLIGVGFFSFFYNLKSFWLVAKIFNFSIGLFCIALGAFAIYDFFKFRKTGSSEELVLQLPKSIKQQIHSVIGSHYRKTKEAPGSGQKQRIAKLLISALVCGFLVSILEAVCTGQVYLPTITFILKASGFKIQALSYLLLYNFMFILPLLLIFIFALAGVTSEQFSRFLREKMLVIKALMAVVFFALGIFLIWKA